METADHKNLNVFLAIALAILAPQPVASLPEADILVFLSKLVCPDLGEFANLIIESLTKIFDVVDSRLHENPLRRTNQEKPVRPVGVVKAPNGACRVADADEISPRTDQMAFTLVSAAVFRPMNVDADHLDESRLTMLGND